MHKIKKQLKKLLTKAVLTCFCLTLGLSSSAVPAHAASNTNLGFNPSSGTIYVGDEFNVQVTIDTDGEPADAVDAFFSYDPSEIEITQFTTGPAFQAYPGQQYNNPPGQVKITGFSVLSPLNGASHVATLRLKALKATNDANIDYEFTLQNPPITTDSNIAKAVTSEDILRVANNASFQFVPDNNPPYTVSHNPAPNATGVPRNTNISFNIKDDERGVDINTVSVNVNGVTYTKNSSQFSFSGSKKNYHIVINPTSNFNFSETVNVTLNGADIDGNAMNPFPYSFTIGDAPTVPNVAPKIVKITPLTDPNNKFLEVEADDPDAPNTDLTLTVSGVPASTPFTDNGDGTGVLDYTNLAPGNYFVSFTATDKGSPPLSGSDGTWIMVGTPPSPPPPAPEVNRPPKFKPVDPIEINLPAQVEGTTPELEQAVINVEATDPDADPLTLTVQAPEMNNFTFIDLGNGTGTLHWTPDKPGLYTAVFTVNDDGNPTLSDTLIVTVFVTGETICPVFDEPAEKTVFVCPTDDEQVADAISEKIDPVLITTREEAVNFILKNLNLETEKSDLFKRCAADYQACLSIFRLNSKYDSIAINNEEIGSLFPDYNTLENQSRRAIDLATVDGFVTGYYGDHQSPFKPKRAVSRIEALTMMLRAADLIPTLYREELVAILGGEAGLKSQKTSFQDIDPNREAHWWYAVPTNAAVKFGIVDQTKNFRPDEFITEEEFLAMFNRLKEFLDQSQHLESIKKDTDSDSITDQNEINIFGTNPLSPDTDADKLTDYEELIIYKTNPNLTDSDNDGLSDYTEIEETGTNPLNNDTDGDGSPDGFEVNVAKSDPKNSDSSPEDKNQNGISDEWEKEHKIFKANVKEAGRDQDTDGDGLSNALEFINKTNPQVQDTDNDGRTDGEEVLLYKTDPTIASEKAQKLKLRFTNIQDGQVVASKKLILQGLAPADKTVSILIRNQFHEKILGTTIADENQVFVFEVPIELQDGEYYLLYKVLDEKTKSIEPSSPIRIVVDSQIAIKAPTPTKLDNATITNDVILQNLRLEIQNNKPTLVGTTDVGNQVIAIWKSVVFTSALIADSATGEFQIQAPNELQPGDHHVFVYAVRPEDQSISETIRIPFVISPKPAEQPDPRKTAIPEKEETIGEKGQALFDEVTETATQNFITIAIIIGVGAFTFIAWRIFFRRDESEDQLPKA